MHHYERYAFGNRESEKVTPLMTGEQLAGLLSEVAYQNTAIIELNTLLVDRLTQPTLREPVERCSREAA